MIGGGRIDSHSHFFESEEVAKWVKETCDVWEYGELTDLPASTASGTLEELLSAMSDANVSRAIVVNCFSIDEWRDRMFEGLDEGLNLSADPCRSHSLLARLMMGYNQWLLRTTANVPQIIPFIALDPWVLSSSELDSHLRWAVENGARGAKIHPIAQRVDFRQEASLEVVRLAAEHGLPLVVHSGRARGSVQFGELAKMVRLASTPDLKLVIAHMGGAAWKQAPRMASDFPKLLFDISELIAWIGAPNAPTAAELVRVIHQIGSDRVMFGSDFPWYDPSDMVQVVENLPGLSASEIAAILGENAVDNLSIV